MTESKMTAVHYKICKAENEDPLKIIDEVGETLTFLKDTRRLTAKQGLVVVTILKNLLDAARPKEETSDH